MIAATRTVRWCMGHRLPGGGDCANLHGHNWEAHLTVVARPGAAEQTPLGPLGVDGMVIELGQIAQRVGGWIDLHWDHGFLLAEWDKVGLDAMKAATVPGHTQKVATLPYDPTTENIARHLLLEVCPAVLRDLPAHVVRVEVVETPNQRAVATFGNH